MDIRVAETTPAFLADVPQIKEKPVSEAFSFTLKRLGDEGLKARLAALVEDINLAGKKLAKHIDLRDLKKYRSLVSEFLGEVVTNAHKFERENVLDRRGRHRVWNIIKMVNQDLDDLAQELIKTEKNTLLILEKTESIYGMLLDFLI